MMGQGMMGMMHAMMDGGSMTPTMPMSMTQLRRHDDAARHDGQRMQGMMVAGYDGPDMPDEMRAMMAGGMMSSTMPMSMTPRRGDANAAAGHDAPGA